MKGARGRKRRGGAQDTRDYPLRSRCPTRSSRGVAPQLLPISIAHTPCLKPALRILSEDRRVAAMPEEVPSCSSQPTRDENSVQEDVKPCISIGSPTSSAPLIQHKMALTSQVEVPPKETPHDQHILEKCKTHDGPSSTRSHSLNLTEFARGLQDDSDDPDQVESAPYERVHGHKVKKEIAPLVGAIFDKYGDITAESNVKSPSIIVTLFLERLCHVYQKLEQRKFVDITRAEINDMLDELHHYENHKFNVGWLLEKLEQICTAKRSTEKYLLIKGEAAKCIEANERIDEEIQHNRRHVALIQKKICAAEQEKEANEVKANKYTTMALDIRARVKALATQSLVHGLL